MQMGSLTEFLRIIIWSLMRTLVWSSLPLLLPIPTAQSLLYVITQSRFVMTTTHIELLVGHMRSWGTPMHTL